MKLKITQAGWETYTGNLAGVEFVNGVATEDASPFICQHVAACIQVEDIETGKNPSASQMLVDAKNTEMDASMQAPDITQVDAGASIAAVGVNSVVWTKKELEAVAAEKGIQGLRDIAEDHPSVKANSINKLLENILKAGISRVVVEEVVGTVEPVVVSAADTVEV